MSCQSWMDIGVCVRVCKCEKDTNEPPGVTPNVLHHVTVSQSCNFRVDWRRTSRGRQRQEMYHRCFPWNGTSQTKRDRTRYHTGKKCHVEKSQPGGSDCMRFSIREDFFFKSYDKKLKVQSDFMWVREKGDASLEKMFHLVLCKRSRNYAPEWFWNSDIIGLYTTLALEKAWGKTPKDDLLLSVKRFALSLLLTQACKLGSFLPPDCEKSHKISIITLFSPKSFTPYKMNSIINKRTCSPNCMPQVWSKSQFNACKNVLIDKLKKKKISTINRKQHFLTKV